MTRNYISAPLLACALWALTACDAHVDDDTLGSIATADEIAANLEVHGITEGSNKIVLKNNNHGIGGMWDYLVGLSNAPCDTVLIPFLGEQTITFYATCGSGYVVVEKKVQIDVIDYPLAEYWTWLCGTEPEGKRWTWDPNPGRGSWGPYGAGGYGWSADVPNWSCTGYGDAYWGGDGPTIDDNEWITFDLNGGANATLHKADGTEIKGSFAIVKGTSADKAALAPSFRNGEPTGEGWWGTLTLTDVTPPAGYLYYYGTASSGSYDIAVFSTEEMVLIEPDPGAILCDPAWASCSTHWCLIPKD
ncbi:MAG: hypothetical protein LIO90_03880 [Bacteroidales bacterium]|nr:hypothetical protein [Bacteroidales bacterium]